MPVLKGQPIKPAAETHTYTLPSAGESSLGLFITFGLAEEGGGERNRLLSADKSNTEIVVECL